MCEHASSRQPINADQRDQPEARISLIPILSCPINKLATHWINVTYFPHTCSEFWDWGEDYEDPSSVAASRNIAMFDFNDPADWQHLHQWV